MKTLTIFILITITAHAQIKATYKTHLDKVLKGYTVYKSPLFTDLNGDKIADAAVIVKNSSKQYCLYSVLSEGTAFRVTMEEANLDKMDLSMRNYKKGDARNDIPKSKQSAYNKIYIYSNDAEFIFGYSDQTKHLDMVYQYHFGP